MAGLRCRPESEHKLKRINIEEAVLARCFREPDGRWKLVWFLGLKSDNENPC